MFWSLLESTIAICLPVSTSPLSVEMNKVLTWQIHTVAIDWFRFHLDSSDFHLFFIADRYREWDRAPIPQVLHQAPGIPASPKNINIDKFSSSFHAPKRYLLGAAGACKLGKWQWCQQVQGVKRTSSCYNLLPSTDLSRGAAPRLSLVFAYLDVIAQTFGALR